MSEASSSVSIRAARVTKWYGKVTALRDVSLHIEPGVWGLLGPNGSGKTTFLQLAAGQLRPSLGEVRICGERPFANPRALRHIGYCPEADALYDELSALSFVATMAELSGFDRRAARERAVEALTTFGLEQAMERRMGSYSRGMRQRVKLAQAIVHDPDVLLLDEPLTGTDPVSRGVILEVLRSRARAGGLVLFSTHVLPEVEALTDQVLLIARGQLVAQGQTHEIRQMLDEHPHHIRVQCDRVRDFASKALGLTAIRGLEFPDEDVVLLHSDDPEATYEAVSRALVDGKHRVESMTSPDASLEALFHYLVERSGRMAGTGADAAVGRGSRHVRSAPKREAPREGTGA